MSDHPHILNALDTLRKNSFIGKHRHFEASSRANMLHVWFGLPGVIISIILSSTFFVLISKEISIEAKWVAAFSGLVGAVLSGIQTFFNFQKISESHRDVANQYLSIYRECEQLIASYCDGLIVLQVLSEKLTSLNSRYDEINKLAEGARTTKRDYRYARKMLRALEAAEMQRGILLRRESPQLVPMVTENRE